MAKIVSRITDEEQQLNRIRTLLNDATGGAIGPGGDLEPGATLAELVLQMDVAFASLISVASNAERLVDALQIDNAFLNLHISRQNAKIKPVVDAVEDGVLYDEDLDHATMDTMEALIASGAAEATSDCEIAFDEKVIISKEDFKPIVRQAVDSWLRLKVRS